MKKYADGVLSEMTQAEISEIRQFMSDIPALEPTTEERISALEVTTDDIILMMAELIGGE